jgi:hypothetical protein
MCVYELNKTINLVLKLHSEMIVSIRCKNSIKVTVYEREGGHSLYDIGVSHNYILKKNSKGINIQILLIVRILFGKAIERKGIRRSYPNIYALSFRVDCCNNEKVIPIGTSLSSLNVM